jgi:hypothetical protein
MKIQDLYLDGRAKVASYRAFLEALLELGLPSLTHRNAIALDADEARYLCVRHDVDHNLETALAMAKLEHALGIRASYYLLPPGDYNKLENYYGRIEGKRLIQSARLGEITKEIAALGHEIGLHNDFLQLSRRMGRSVDDLVLEQITYFHALGVEVVGSASHGSRFARAHNYVNYEIFAECARPQSVRRQITFDNGDAFDMFSIPMCSLGLEYEAYSIVRDVYISDTGSRMLVGGEYHDQLVPTMLSDLVGTASRVVVLIHPDWWKLSDSEKLTSFCATPASVVVAGGAAAGALGDGGIRFARSDGKPYRVGVRGDCCSRRALVMNKHLFPNGVELIINEKSPNACFVETMAGCGATRDVARGVCDIEAMPGSLKHYFAGQFERSVLDAESLDLLVMDNYSDMNFERWRHRTQGWSLWVHPKFVRDPEGFKRDFEKLGYCSFDEAVDAICAVIEHVRQRNPGLPVLFLNQPVEYYPKLEKRKSFYAIGEAVARRLPLVYQSEPLTLEALVPADVDSCGPGLTLHFDAGTYLRMIETAWQRGLGDCLTQRQSGYARVPAAPAETLSPVLTSAPSAPASELALALTLPTGLADDGLPIVHLSFGEGSSACKPACAAQVEAAFKTYTQYFRLPEVDPSCPTPRFTPMLIAVDDILDFAAWEAHIKTFGNGARLRQKRKALGLGCTAKLFPWKQFIPDVHAVNHSKSVRSGGAMRGSYLRSVEEMGGEPTRAYEVVYPECPNHWSLQFGAFLPAPGHMQGSVEVNERLLAYISLRRCGDVALYSQIMGHGAFLDKGVLVLLHHEVIRWIGEHRDDLTHGLRYVMYGGMQNGGESLLQFKRQAGFTPHHVYALRSTLPTPPAAAQEMTHA